MRARLLKIREKNKGAIGALATSSEPNPQTITVASHFNVTTGDGQPYGQAEGVRYDPILEESITAIKKLLEKSFPLEETDQDIVACTDVLKNIHAAVSKQPNLAVGIDAPNVTKLREDIKDGISSLVETLTRLIDFGFKCHHQHISSGLSVPLLSVNLASLMAIFRSNDLATLVNVDDLTILIKEAGKALLDPRLAASSKSTDPSQLDEATSTQMVRAINKLAVQAATGARRENSLLALIRLQEQLSLNAEVTDDLMFNSRLSRIVTKLMTRVIKAEENSALPFDSSSLDVETIICCLEDSLDACDKAEAEDTKPEGIVATRNLAKLVVSAMLKARGESANLRREMEELEIDPDSSALGQMVALCATELNIPLTSTPANQQPDIASLVSAVGSAEQGSAREEAVNALKRVQGNIW